MECFAGYAVDRMAFSFWFFFHYRNAAVRYFLQRVDDFSRTVNKAIAPRCRSVLPVFIFVGMSKTVFHMLYTAPSVEQTTIISEKFEITHFASLTLLVLLIALGLCMPAQLCDIVGQISKDFGIIL